MLKWRCPYCGTALDEAESELGVGRECPKCTMVSDCPQEEYHKQRLRRLAEMKQTRSLTPAELREAAIHYRALGRDDRAKKAMEKAERIAKGERAELDIEVEAVSDELPLGVKKDSTPKVVGKYAEWPDAINRPVGIEIASVTASAALFVVLVIFGMMVDTAPCRLALLFFGNGLAAMLIGAGCGARGGNCGLGWFIGLLCPPLGAVYAFMTTTWERVTVSDNARMVGGVFIGLGTLPWVVIAYLAYSKHFFSEMLTALGVA